MKYNFQPFTIQILLSKKLTKNKLGRINVSLISTFIIFILLLPVFLIDSFAEIQFNDVTIEAGFSYVGKSYGSSWGDFNGDGWADLWTVNHGAGPSMYLNNQNGTFSNISKDLELSNHKGKDPHSSAWADFDNDGDQDIIVLRGGGGPQADGTKGRSNSLFVNESGNFTDKAEIYEIEYKGGRGRGPLWLDYDNDGYLDILVVNDKKIDGTFPSALFKNKKTHFENSNISSISANHEPGFLNQISDLTNDGKMNLVITHGQKIKVLSYSPLSNDFVNEFEITDISGTDIALSDFNGDNAIDIFIAQAIIPSKKQAIGFELFFNTPSNSMENIDFALGDFDPKSENILTKVWDKLTDYINQETFDQPETLSKSLRYCSNVVSGDFDNDMDVDIYLVCSTEKLNLPNVVLENLGNGIFSIVPEMAKGSDLGIGDSASTVDFDNDGLLDIFITNGKNATHTKQGPDQLYRNISNQNHWIEIDLIGVVSNRDGIGSRVIVETDDIKQIREQGGGVHNRAQNHQRLHFGLENFTQIDKISVYWPSGLVNEFKNIKSNQIIELTEQVTSPKKQLSIGIEAKNVICKENFKLILKPSGNPACVSSSTADILLQRGWHLPI